MRVVLEIESGPNSGHRIRLSTDQILQVGRSEWADVACPYDAEMSKIHFQLQTDRRGCFLEDLKSSNGTLLNDEPATRASLRDGDAIVAGKTRFRIHLEGGESAPRPAPDTAPVQASATSAPTPVPAPAPRGENGRIYTAEPCESGLTLFRGSMDPVESPFRPSVLAGKLAEQLPLFLIVHFLKIGQPVPDELKQAVPLFDWLPEEIARNTSPLIVAPGACQETGSLVDAMWDTDSLVCLFSLQDDAALAEHLRAAVHFDMQGHARTGENDDSLLGYCWPSVLSQLLSFRDADFVGRLLLGIGAVLIEMPDLPETWQIFAHADFARTLENAGYRPAPS